MSSAEVVTRSQLSPVALPFSPGPAPTAGEPTASNASQMPRAGMALKPLGRPLSSNASVTMVKVRFPLTGKLNQSACPTWLSLPHHNPLAGNIRGAASVEIASIESPVAESATFTLSVFCMPAERFGSEIGASVPEGSGEPATYGPTEFA